MFSFQCLTRIEGDRLGQPSFCRRPPLLDWTYDRPARMRADVDPSGRVPVGQRSRRFLPVHVPVLPLTVKQAENLPVADHRFLHQPQCLLRAGPLLR